MGSLTSYTLFELREDIIREFGLDSSDSGIVAMVSDQINKAQHWLMQHREARYWSRGRLALSVRSPLTGLSGNFTLGSPTVTAVSSMTDINAGDIIAPTGVSPETGGYVIAAVDVPGATITLDANYLGATTTGQVFSAHRPRIALPDDFERLWSIRDVQSIKHDLVYVTPDEYEQRLWDGFAPLNKVHYTIDTPLIDELDTVSQKYFIALLPFPTTDTVLRGIYYRTLKDMSDANDIPRVPRTHRLVLLYTAQWFVAVHLKRGQDTVDHYKEMAAVSQINMNKNYEKSDDMQREDRQDFIGNYFDDDEALRASFDFPIE
jgi:hypothetical protein